MKDTRPIEVQVSELTAEQKANMKRVFKTQLIIAIVAILVAVIAVVLVFSAYKTEREAREDYEDANHAYMEKMSLMYFDEDLKEEAEEAYEEWEESSKALGTTFLVMMVAGVVLTVLYLVAALSMSKKYPYYSEKKYLYIKKHNLW